MRDLISRSSVIDILKETGNILFFAHIAVRRLHLISRYVQ